MIEVMQCCNVAIKEVDRRKRVIRRKEYSKDTAISIRPTKEGIHMIIHIGNKAEIYFSSKFHASVIEDEDKNLLVVIPEFSSYITLSLSSKENASVVLAAFNDSGRHAVENKENQHENTAFLPATGAFTNPTSKDNVWDKYMTQAALRIASPVKSSGLTPSKKKKKQSSASPPVSDPRAQRDGYLDFTQNTHDTAERSAGRSGVSSPDPPPDLSSLSLEQRQIVQSCAAGNNVFYTGGAGTGKSHTLRQIVNQLVRIHGRDGVFVTATTGLAACAVGGVTVHQFAGIRPGDSPSLSPEAIKQRHSARRRWMQARVLVVDEVSMMSPSVLELLNLIAQASRASPKPMGGVQVIFAGDFFQLPPVEASSSTALTQQCSRPTERFCFQSEVWSQIFKRDCCFVLSKVYRQEDPSFVTLLDAIRWGALSENTLAAFAPCVERALDCEDGILPTRIFTHRRDVDSLNNRELENLTGEQREFIAVDDGDKLYMKMLQNHCPARQQVKLKVGCQVLLVKSIDPALGLVNGARGVVTAFTRSSQRPVVRFSDGVERPISTHTFTISLGGRTVAQRSQIPLILAWGISVHKSQGMSVDRAIIDIRNAFEYGQAYVALSRVRTMNGLSLTHHLCRSHIKSHPDVKQFYLKMADEFSS